MRLFTIHPNTIITYTHVLHGHSHLAILGWAFLGVFIIFLTTFWEHMKQQRQAKILIFFLFIISSIMFIAFLYQGYAVFSIIMSTTHIFIEYWAAVFIYQQLKRHNDIPKSGRLFINSGIIALLISSIGPFALGYISANGLKDSYWFDMAMYFYLHFQYNGWLTLFLIGMFIIIVHRRNIPIQSHLLNLGFWCYFISLFPSYFLSILWIDLGNYNTVLAIIGGIGQWLGVLFILAAFKRIWRELIQPYSAITATSLAITLLLLLIKSTMELGLMLQSLAPLIYDTRSIVIGYLHLTLLGFISIFIVTQYFMLNIIPSSSFSIFGFIVFIVGFIANEGLLFGQGLLEWLKLPGIPFYSVGLLLASGLLFVGIVMLWISFGKKQHRSL